MRGEGAWSRASWVNVKSRGDPAEGMREAGRSDGRTGQTNAAEKTSETLIKATTSDPALCARAVADAVDHYSASCGITSLSTSATSGPRTTSSSTN